MYTYRGNIHVHSTLSDGTKSVDEIAEIANKANLDFVCITDHSCFDFDKTGYYDDLLLIMGTELNKKKHHYLALGINEEVKEDCDNPQSVINKVKEQNGVGIIAHPCEKGSKIMFNGANFPWTDWEVDGYDGIEVWNYCSQWKDGISSKIQALKNLLFTPYKPITGPCPESMRIFDKVSQKRKVFAIAGTDIHSPKIGIWEILSYKQLFNALNNYVITDEKLPKDANKAEWIILDSIKRGRSYFAFEVYQKAEGFKYFIQSEKDKQVHSIGSELQLAQGLTADIKLPENKKADIYLIKNGSTFSKLMETSEASVSITDCGVYRVEVWLGKSPWIFSNNIYIRE
ncbi:CehA/McbA family metallohydrolase [Proteinivorax hydrogeniformans]|uniref:CehA/McbA family metallohydrolase n=1 Tax=Proteinivorax hydrogeniformans TaxID=1826727 RepID=A0AAU8HPY2_9FIRM